MQIVGHKGHASWCAKVCFGSPLPHSVLLLLYKDKMVSVHGVGPKSGHDSCPTSCMNGSITPLTVESELQEGDCCFTGRPLARNTCMLYAD